MITQDGEQLGVLSLTDALAQARERGVDLVEVAPNADPPVCRLLDYGRYRYMQSKETKRKRVQDQLKAVRFAPRHSTTGEHDFQIKRAQIERFLVKGHRVRVSVRLRGRQLAHPNVAVGMLRRLATELASVASVESDATQDGRQVSMTLAPVKLG